MFARFFTVLKVKGDYDIFQFTIGYAFFAECMGHSAKPHLHSAKALPSVALGKGHSVKKLSAKLSLPSAFCRALGKGFAEYQTLGKGFAEYQTLGKV
jgi:hypothetical protein